MKYYLKKFWKVNALVIFFLLASSALNTTASLLMMRLFQGIIELDLQQFFFWYLALMRNWLILIAVGGLETYFEARAVRMMNNTVRQDMVATLLQKNTENFMRWTLGNTSPGSPTTSTRLKIWHMSHFQYRKE